MENEIRKYLNENIKDRLSFRVYDSVSSTNAVLKEKFSPDTVVVARSQTSGRGQKDRSFFSPKDSGIYLSLGVAPALSASDCGLITCLAAVSVAIATENIAKVNPKIKWVNDLYLDNKKYCGILSESKLSGSELSFAVVGIGVNLFPPKGGFPPELEAVATSIFDDKKELSYYYRFIAEILNVFYSYFDNITNKAFLKEYRNRCINVGEKVNVKINGIIYVATATEIDDNFHLIVTLPNGEQKTVISAL